MSGILFQINHDGSQVNRKDFLKMFSLIEHRGGDGSNHIFNDNVSAGCHYFWTTPEDVGETQPLVSKDKNIWLLLDGRIDNREELINGLGLNVKSAGSLPDAALFLEAYQKWQERCFSKLVGSFAAIIYLPKVKKIFALRDQAGDRTLFYYNDKKKLIISSEPYSITTSSTVPKILNKKKVAEYLALKHPTDSDSYFQDIYELLPAHYVEFKSSKAISKRYWEVNPSERIRYRTDDEYAGHFLELFEKSISSKMRSVKPPGVMMSGGLDSTSIAAIAGKYSEGNIKTFSYIFKKYKNCDESDYIKKFCNMHDADSFKLNGDEYLPLVDVNKPCVSPNFPNEDSYQTLKNELYRRVLCSGSNVLLTGWYADQLFAGAEHWLKDGFRDLNLPVVYNNLKHLVSQNGLMGLRKDSAVRTALRPFRPIKNLIWGPPPVIEKYSNMTLYAKSLINDTGDWNSEIEKTGRKGQILNVLGLRTAYDASACSHCTTGVNIDFRYPYRDIRLIEFFLKLPAYQLYDSTEYKSKYILRNAMKGKLPREILERRKSTDFIDLLEESYRLNKKDKNRMLENGIDELGEYIDNNILNVIINKKFRDYKGLESNLFWAAYTYLEWKKRIFK